MLTHWSTNTHYYPVTVTYWWHIDRSIPITKEKRRRHVWPICIVKDLQRPPKANVPVQVCLKQVVSYSGANYVYFSSWFLSLILLVFVTLCWYAAARFAFSDHVLYRDGRPTTSFHLVFRDGFSNLKTTDWIFEISLFRNSINQSRAYWSIITYCFP